MSSPLIEALERAYAAERAEARRWRFGGCGPAHEARCKAILELAVTYGYRLETDDHYNESLAFSAALADERGIPEALWPDGAERPVATTFRNGAELAIGDVVHPAEGRPFAVTDIRAYDAGLRMVYGGEGRAYVGTFDADDVLEVEVRS